MIWLLFLLPVPLYADAIDLQAVAVKYQQFFPGAVDPMITDGLGHHLDKELNLTVDADILTYGYWNSTVHSETDQYQFRKVGLESELGLHLGSKFDLYYSHYSQHLLDYAAPDAFPRQDGYGVRLYLYKK